MQYLTAPLEKEQSPLPYPQTPPPELPPEFPPPELPPEPELPELFGVGSVIMSHPSGRARTAIQDTRNTQKVI
jgi:hypothetical protein